MCEESHSLDELKAMLADAQANRYCADMIDAPHRRSRELDRWDRQVAFLKGRVGELSKPMNRPLYRPSEVERLSAIEILLASEISLEARRVIREMEQEISEKKPDERTQ